jgi:predicted peptidase
VLAGQPTVITDSSGRVVARDRGSIHYRLLFDTGGDTDPDRQFAGFSGFEVHGPHDTDFCASVGALVGISQSSQRYNLRPLGTTASPMGYAEYLPPSYGQTGLSPLLVFLHGSGEGGDGSAEQLQALARAAIPGYIAHDAWPDDRPFVVLAPQHVVSGDLSAYSVCDGVEFGASCALTVQHNLGNPTPGSVCVTPQEVHEFIAYAVATYAVDPNRVYLTGLSCGGYGVWEYLSQHLGGQVAAAVPVSGEGRPAWQTAGCTLGAVPLWAFHGGADPVVDPAGSIEAITQLQACSSPTARDARLAVYPDAYHDSAMWAQAYAVGTEHDIYTWMLGHTRT